MFQDPSPLRKNQQACGGGRLLRTLHSICDLQQQSKCGYRGILARGGKGTRAPEPLAPWRPNV